ncbi:hypothetical protein ACEF16_11480, partial [Streptococcus thoraltensis]
MGDIAKFVENMFYHCFSSILFRELETVDKRMYSFSDHDLILIQSRCLRLSSTFANLNIQRKNFLASDEPERETFQKKDKIEITFWEKSLNLPKKFSTKKTQK